MLQTRKNKTPGALFQHHLIKLKKDFAVQKKDCIFASSNLN